MILFFSPLRKSDFEKFFILMKMQRQLQNQDARERVRNCEGFAIAYKNSNAAPCRLYAKSAATSRPRSFTFFTNSPANALAPADIGCE